MNFINARNILTLLEVCKWVLIVFLLIGSIVLHYMCRDCTPYIKNIGVCFLLILLGCVVLNTKLGKLLIIFGKEAVVELQKVVWPTWQDTLNTTFIVSLVTMIISLILWGLDTVLVRVISFGLRL